MGPDVRQYFTQMMNFLSTYHLQGLVLGLCSFLIIGICHPIVIKGEYHYGQPFKWVTVQVGFPADRSRVVHRLATRE